MVKEAIKEYYHLCAINKYQCVNLINNLRGEVRESMFTPKQLGLFWNEVQGRLTAREDVIGGEEQELELFD